MDQACELIRLLPELLAGRGLLKRVPLEPIANQIRDVLDEFSGSQPAPPEGFEHAEKTSSNPTGPFGEISGEVTQQEGSWIGLAGLLRSAVGRNKLGSPPLKSSGPEADHG